MPTGDVVLRRDASVAAPRRIAEIERVAEAGNVNTLNTNRIADRMFGDTVLANVIMLGFAWQSGFVPFSHAAIVRAIELNNVSA
jgi:indolepyruvate ferredoxin oxidoreductase